MEEDPQVIRHRGALFQFIGHELATSLGDWSDDDQPGDHRQSSAAELRGSLPGETNGDVMP